jgi:hypothetical protein
MKNTSRDDRSIDHLNEIFGLYPSKMEEGKAE